MQERCLQHRQRVLVMRQTEPNARLLLQRQSWHETWSMEEILFTRSENRDEMRRRQEQTGSEKRPRENPTDFSRCIFALRNNPAQGCVTGRWKRELLPTDLVKVTKLPRKCWQEVWTNRPMSTHIFGSSKVTDTPSLSYTFGLEDKKGSSVYDVLDLHLNAVTLPSPIHLTRKSCSIFLMYDVNTN